MKRLVALMMCAMSLGATSQLTFEFVLQSDSTVFLISDGEVNYWSEAEDICQSFGGHLATFSSLEENLAVFDIVGAGPWIGLIQSPEGDEPNGGWSWVKSESLSYENWSANEPNEHHSGEDFGQLYVDGGWNDIRNYDTDPHRVLMEVSLSLNLVGCTNTDACNFMEQATIDDGSCHFNCQFCQDGTVWDEEIQGCISANTADINNDGCVQLNDLLDLLSAYGDCAAEESAWQCGEDLEYGGDNYGTIQIGEQCWFSENLRSNYYSDGSLVESIQNNSNWANGNVGMICTYGNVASNEDLYGSLYNWHAVADVRGLCPTGWHVPEEVEWQGLLGSAGGAAVAGQTLKAQDFWAAGAQGNDALGFDGRPGGYRRYDGTYQTLGSKGYWWTSTAVNEGQATIFELNSTAAVATYPDLINGGFSVRCIKNFE